MMNQSRCLIVDMTDMLHVWEGPCRLRRPLPRTRVLSRGQRESMSGTGGSSTSSERSRRVPPPPPPPPPPLYTTVPRDGGLPTLDRRQKMIASGLLVAGVVVGIFSGIGGGMPSSEYERELSYVASQVGVRGMPSPVSAVVDRLSGRIVGVRVIGKTGQEYLATVDPNKPSVLVLRAVGTTQASSRPGAIYRLPTRYERINIGNRRQIETIFRVPNWESMML